MGGENLKTIEIAAAGSSSLIGQQYSVEGNWPQFEVANYTRAIDFDAKWSREDYTRRQGNFPTFGRVPMAEQRITAIVSGAYAWDMRDTTPVPITRRYLDGVPVNELRQLELAITPHGFLKAALAAKDAKAIKIQYIGASDFGLSQFGRWVTIVSFTFLGKYKIVGTIDDQNLVELVGTWFPNPVYGDMDYEMRYTEYKDFGGVKFPMLLHTHQGDPAAERRAQLLRVPRHEREAERAGDDDAGAGCRAYGRDAAGEGRESAARRTASGCSAAARTTACSWSSRTTSRSSTRRTTKSARWR